MEKIYEKCFKLKPCGMRDLWLCRLGKCNGQCPKTLNGFASTHNEIRTVDNVLSFKEACLVLKQFSKFLNGHLSGVSILTLIGLHAMITDALDDVSQSIKNTTELSGNISFFLKNLWVESLCYWRREKGLDSKRIGFLKSPYLVWSRFFLKLRRRRWVIVVIYSWDHVPELA